MTAVRFLGVGEGYRRRVSEKGVGEGCRRRVSVGEGYRGSVSEEVVVIDGVMR
jgi:hypothetical protein